MATEYTNNLILVEKYPNGVAKVTLNNPPVNTVSLAMTREFHETLCKIRDDEEIRCVVLNSASMKNFCVGSNVKEFPSVMDDVVDKKLRLENETFNLLEYIPQATIAAIEGTLCGGGMEMAMACDIRIMSDASRAAFPEINLGIFPASGGSFRLPKLVGVGKAKELTLLGEFIPAEECLRIGLVNRLAPAGTVLDAAMEMAGKIAAKSRDSVKVIKSSIREMAAKTSEDCFWQNLHYSDHLFQTPNCREGVQAFIEKRPAKFE